MAGRKAQITKVERFVKWEKAKVEKAATEIILKNATTLVDTLVDIAITDRNPNAINSLLDRAFGKARQNIGLDGGAVDKPIVFMPAQLLTKYNITPGTYSELKSGNDEDPAGVLIEPVDVVQ